MADISSQVQESLSVSGILLGKTMGRTEELARRFEAESGRLADLEVRSRMTGRWMMASIQTSFAVMPALVYLFAGHFAGSVSLGTVIAFTTLQARLFFRSARCSGSGSRCRPRSRSSTASSSTSTSRRHRAGSADARGAAGRRRLRRRLLPLRGRPLDARRRHLRRAAGSKTALVGETGSGKTTAGYLVARLYDATEDGLDRRDRRAASSLSSRSRTRSASSARRRTSSTRPCATTSASPAPTRPTRRSRRRRGRRRSTT